MIPNNTAFTFVLSLVENPLLVFSTTYNILLFVIVYYCVYNVVKTILMEKLIERKAATFNEFF